MFFGKDKASGDKPITDKYGRDLVYSHMSTTMPNRATRRQHGIRRPLSLITQHRDLLESMVSMADEGLEEVNADDPGD